MVIIINQALSRPMIASRDELIKPLLFIHHDIKNIIGFKGYFEHYITLIRNI